MYTRRDIGRLALAAVPAARLLAEGINSRINGVTIGAQTYSFRDRPLESTLDAMQKIGFGQVELFQGHVEPKLQGNELRDWRLSTPMDYFTEVRAKFDKAGIKIFAYTLNFRDNFTDDEIDRGFQATKAMGTDLITTSTTLTCAKRLVPFAEKHKVRVAMHGHDKTDDPNEFAKPESFAAAMEMSKQFYVNLDIGHFTAAGYDAVDYIQQHHDKVLVLHIKDRKKNHGPNMPFGDGETPIKGVLQLLKTKQWDIPADIEYEYGKPGLDTLVEVSKCFQYCKDALA
ncbi:MAG TPA: sugar phosphate isomerase/epimerase [Bryobacteraceae bacterium]|nr:sugar phosphate isomerase/epimerase [Bryobacteraceae bacterium]